MAFISDKERIFGPAFFARREVPDRLSNGDGNPITIYLENQYAFPRSCGSN